MYWTERQVNQYGRLWKHRCLSPMFQEKRHRQLSLFQPGPALCASGGGSRRLYKPLLNPGFSRRASVYTAIYHGTVMTPGREGANWGGASFDPTNQVLYVSGFGPLTYLVRLQPGNEPDFYFAFQNQSSDPTQLLHTRAWVLPSPRMT